MIFGEILGYDSCDYRGVVSLSISYHLDRDIPPGVCLDIIDTEYDEFFVIEIAWEMYPRNTELIQGDREHRLIIFDISAK